jgi:putative transposase
MIKLPVTPHPFEFPRSSGTKLVSIHLLKLCRYVERNPLAAGVVGRAEQWRYGSLWIKLNGDAKQRSILSAWPLDRPRDWTRLVNQPLHEADLASIRTSLERGRPLGSDTWTQKMVERLDLRHTMRQEGRPRKDPSDKN